MYTCGIRIHAKLVKVGSFRINGDDNILNEYIYSTIDLFLPVYKKLFNYILHHKIGLLVTLYLYI